MTLELQAQKRTAQLRQALNYQFLEGYISQGKNKNLDERQIWQTATRGLAQILKVNHCQVELYNSTKSTATVNYEYTTSLPLEQEVARKTADFPELYEHLLERECLQFAERIPFFSLQPYQTTRLACPIHTDRDIFGNIWLIKPKEQMFQEWEIQLVKQVANQCAEAFSQSKFYRQASKQIRELEELNQKKDDFFKAISHELRNHSTSIRLAAQTLENLLESEMAMPKSQLLPKVFRIFQQACQQQTRLVDDLMTLAHGDDRQQAINPQWIDLSTWITKRIESFLERVYIQQQTLTVDITANIPLVKTDSPTLERIVVELLHNACKYTPQGETINVAIGTVGDRIQLSVTNTGVEIPASEQKRIFEPLYRLSNHDFWSTGGTGLGLNLVQKLAQVLDASIHLTSHNQKTTFALFLPIDESFVVSNVA